MASALPAKDRYDSSDVESYGMTNIEPSGGTVVLRGHTIAVDSDIGTAFVIDCCRHIEDLISAEALKAKYQLSPEAWCALAESEPLQRAVGAAKERRVRSGEAAKEKAAALFVEAWGYHRPRATPCPSSGGGPFRPRIRACPS
jgi:hypothetical protein